MNTLQLIQQVCRRWLTVPDQGALDAAAAQDLIAALNVTQGEIWRALPVHYRNRVVSWDFYGPATGTVTVGGYGSRTVSGVAFPTIQDILTYQGEPLFYGGEPLMFNGQAVTESPRPYCSILLAGDGILNQFTGAGLVHPYLGTAVTSETPTGADYDFSNTVIDFSSETVDFSVPTVSTTGVVAATLYHDAKLLTYQVERLTGPVIDRATRQVYHHVENHRFSDPHFKGRLFSLQRVMHAGVMRSMVQLPPGHDSVVVLSSTALVSPIPLTLGSSLRAVDLPYDEEIGGLIAAAAGTNLTWHPLFRKDRSMAEAAAAAQQALGQLDRFSPRTTSQAVQIGTPCGW